MSRSHTNRVLSFQLSFTFLCGLLALPRESQACSVPVFRYALERWNSRAYELIVYYEEDLPATVQKAIKDQEMKPVNLLLWSQKVSEMTGANEDVLAIWNEEKDRAKLPWIVLRYPHQYWNSTTRKTVWSGPLDEKTLFAINDSPARRELSSSILKGASTVWLFMDGEDAGENEKLLHVLRERLAYIDEVAQLPTDIVDSAEEGPLGKETPGYVPMKVGNDILRISRDQDEEFFLRQMLMNIKKMYVAEKDKGKEDTSPVVFPVFGQGKALWPLVGSSIQPDLIDEAVSFILGPCSCTIQDQNPGVDLLVHANWYAGVTNLVFGFSEMPPLTGITEPVDGIGPVTNEHEVTNDTQKQSAPPARGTALAAGIGLLLVVVAMIGVKIMTRDRE